MSLNAPQPPPTKNDDVAVWDAVLDDLKRWSHTKAMDLLIADIRERDQMGEKKYGTRLKVWNGRDASVDAYQEALDLTVYLKQCAMRTASHDAGSIYEHMYLEALKFSLHLRALMEGKPFPITPPANPK